MAEENDWKISIYHHPNPEIKSFLTDTEISTARVERFNKPLGKDWERNLKQLGIIGAQLVKEIMALTEVQEVHIRPKEIRIKKEISSSWQEIEKQVLYILDRALKRKKIKLIKA